MRIWARFRILLASLWWSFGWFEIFRVSTHLPHILEVYKLHQLQMSVFFLVRLLTAYGWIRLMSDMSRLEAKVERLTDQLASKERELQALTSKVFSVSRPGQDLRHCDRSWCNLMTWDFCYLWKGPRWVSEFNNKGTVLCTRSKKQQLLTGHSWQGSNMRKMSSSAWWSALRYRLHVETSRDSTGHCHVDHHVQRCYVLPKFIWS
jgi:hypothetical protein